MSESQHAILKSSMEYVVTKSRGMDLMCFITFLEKLDGRGSHNANGSLGLPHGATPLLNRSKKRRRTEPPQYVEVDSKIFLSSQPKRAKKN